MRRYIIGILVVVAAAVLGFAAAYGTAALIHQRVAVQTNSKNTQPNQSQNNNRQLPFDLNVPGQPGPQYRRNFPGFPGGQGQGFPGQPNFQQRPFNSPGLGKNNGNTPNSPAATPTPPPPPVP